MKKRTYEAQQKVLNTVRKCEEKDIRSTAKSVKHSKEVSKKKGHTKHSKEVLNTVRKCPKKKDI